MTAGARSAGSAARPSNRAPSGTQYAIEHSGQRAVVTQVGATLREYTVDGRALVDGFGVDQRATDGRGQVLAPWPNRLTGGRYMFGGQVFQAPLTEPSRSGAIHGLVRWLEWTELEVAAAAVTLHCVVPPQPGYEWSLDLKVGYRLAEDGLSVRVDVVNISRQDAPFGAGFHPYLTLGVPVDRLALQLPARSWLPPVDPDTPPVPALVAGTEKDFTNVRAIGATVLDTAYGDLARDADGRAVTRLSDPDGAAVELWVDEGFGYLMVYTGDHVRAPERRRRAIAVEPMSCPPDALRSGTDLIVLSQDESWHASWGIRG